MPKQELNKLLLELGELFGIPGLCLDEKGVCQLVFDRRHTVHLVEHFRGYLLITCNLADVPTDERLDKMFLRANYAQAAGGVVLARSPDDTPCAQLSVPLASAQASVVLEQMEQLITEVERWQQRVTGTPHQPDDPSLFLRSIA